MKRLIPNISRRLYSSTLSSWNKNIPNQAGQLSFDLSQKESKRPKQSSMETLLAHAGLQSISSSENDNTSQNAPLAPPITFATTFERPPNGDYGPNGNIYSRIQNPTRTLLEQTLSELEHDDESKFCHEKSKEHPLSYYCTTYASGMAAISSILLAHEPKVHVIVPDDVYHGVPSQLVQALTSKHGISYSSVDMTNLSKFERSLSDISNSNKYKSVVIWLESPSNPLCKVTDIHAICELVKSMPAVCENRTIVVDSTWAPPCITQPLMLGADVVIHSGTKYLGGHSDVLLGAVTCSSKTKQGINLSTKLRTIQSAIGAVSSPMDAWLTLRGLRTLHIRLERQCGSAMTLAVFLQDLQCKSPYKNIQITNVHYPGLKSHPQHILAQHQMKSSFFGGMLSIEVGGPPSSSLNDTDRAMAFAGALKLIKRATSLGGTESLIEHRASIEPETRVVSPQGLLRVSVGLENVLDLQHDIEHAFGIADKVLSQMESK